MRKKQLIILLFIAIAIPSVIYYVYEIIDPYYCITLATVERSIQNGVITPITFGDFSYDPYNQGHLGYESMTIILAEVLGLSIESVAIIPIGGVVLPIVVFVFGKKLFNSTYIACFLAFFFAFDPSLSPGQYNTFIYAWERILLFIFLIIIIRILDNGENRDKILLLIVFIGTFSLYWTTPFIMLLFLIVVNIMLIIDRHKFKNSRIMSKINKRMTSSITIAIAVIIFTYNIVLYREFLPAIINEKYGGFFEGIEQLLSWFFGSGKAGVEEYSMIGSTTPLLDILLISRYILILTPIVLFIIVVILKSLRKMRMKKEPKQFSKYALIFVPTIIAGMAQSIAYSLRGHISLRYISIMFLPLTIISLEGLGAKKSKTIVISILLIIVTAGFGVMMYSDFPGLNKTTNVEFSEFYILEKSDTENRILTDLNTFGVYLVNGIKINESRQMIFYNSSIYGLLLYGLNESTNQTIVDYAEYITLNINMAESPIASPGWKLYKPISDYYGQIGMNNYISKIYDDGHCWVYST